MTVSPSLILVLYGHLVSLPPSSAMKCWILLTNPPLLLQLACVGFCNLLGIGKGFTEDGGNEQEIGSEWHGGRVG